jgi:hypothetical protein
MINQYDIIKIVNLPIINDGDFLKHNKRLPAIGDMGTVVEIYTHPYLGYEIECCEPGTGITEWMHAFTESELLHIIGTAV